MSSQGVVSSKKDSHNPGLNPIKGLNTTTRGYFIGVVTAAPKGSIRPNLVK